MVRSPKNLPAEIVVAGLALLAALAVQWALALLFHGANYYGVDGKMAQTLVLTTFKFAGYFDVTNLNPIQGAGSQLLPKNVWINPAFWPFAWLDKDTATDVSALIAFACFAGAVYVMMRCFDIASVPSALAMWACIVLFAPTVLVLRTPTNFMITPGDAVTYAPYMVALGLLARVRPGAWLAFGLIAVGICVLVFYSICCDPLWTMIAAMSLAVPFAVVTFSRLDGRTIALRCAALGCCLVLIVVSGAASYLYTLSQYTARVQFAEALDRVRGPELVSTLSFSWSTKYIYLACAIGWLLGLALLRGRPRGLVVAAIATFVAWLAYSIIYLLLLNAPWVLPIPRYLEHGVFALYLAAAIAGYWSARGTFAAALARMAAPFVRRRDVTSPAPARRIHLAALALLLLCAVVTAKIGNYGLARARTIATATQDPWANEPEFIDFLADNGSVAIGRPFRGSVNLPSSDPITLNSLVTLWAHDVPSLNEYSQLVTPEALYFVHALLKRDVRYLLNHFTMFWPEGGDTPAYWPALAMMGVRHSVTLWPLPSEVDPGLPLVTKPHRPGTAERQPGTWYIYELPHPNVGNYSPTEVVTADSGAEIMTTLGRPGFDFARQVVVTEPLAELLVPARHMQFSFIRGGLHVSGTSDGTSLVVLPQQFSHCLRARSGNVRFVRANLLMTGMIFSGDIDTDIVFDYGIFSSTCRRADLAQVRHLDLKIDLRMPHLMGDRLFPDWNSAMARLRAAVGAIK